MGNSASKSISKTVKPLAKAPGVTMPFAKRAVPPVVSESKSAAIQSDGQDPTYMANLNALGAVIVPRAPTLFKPDNRMLEILKQRKVAEELDDSPQLNRLTAQSLSNLFDERKSISNKEEVEELIKSYGMDVATFEALSRHITAPSVAKIKTEKEDEDETQIAKWVELKHDTTTRIAAK